MDVSKFPKPHIPQKLPISEIVTSLLADQHFLRSAFQASTSLSAYIGYLANLPNPEILVASLTLQESVLSSRIEGTIATLSDVVNDTGNNQVIRDDIVEITNYVKAMKYGSDALKDRDFKFSSFFIRELHAILMSNNVRGAKKTPGLYKVEQNYIANSLLGAFTPLSPELTPEYIENLVEYMNDITEAATLLQAGIVHAQFEMIHPFQDGNGRIGRLLIPLLLYAKKEIPFPTFYISRYFASNDNDYKQCLFNISKTNDKGELLQAWKTWLEFLFAGVMEESSKHIETSKRIKALFDEMHSAVKRTDQGEIIDYLFQNLRVEAADYAKNSALPRSTVYNTLKNLADMGYITRSDNRKAQYVFSKLVDIVE